MCAHNTNFKKEAVDVRNNYFSDALLVVCWDKMSRNRWVVVLVAVVFFILGFLVLLQQRLTWGVWFELKDLHHETIAVDLIIFGVGILVGSFITQTNRKKAKETAS